MLGGDGKEGATIASPGDNIIQEEAPCAMASRDYDGDTGALPSAVSDDVPAGRRRQRCGYDGSEEAAMSAGGRGGLWAGNAWCPTLVVRFALLVRADAGWIEYKKIMGVE